MAASARGRALTEAHRLQQVAIANQAATVGSALWGLLDVADLDGSTPAWLLANTNTARTFFDQSASAAAGYYGTFRQAEIGESIPLTYRPDFDLDVNRNALLLAGPVRVKSLIGTGVAPDAAKAAALTAFIGIMRRQTLMGGRFSIDGFERRDERAKGWRRVTDGDPCAFCAMLATRGPVYGSAEKAEQIGGTGLRYHSNCACTAEPIYTVWEPSAREREFIRDYERAAQEVDDLGLPRTEENVLPRMRRLGEFRDSPSVRNLSIQTD